MRGDTIEYPAYQRMRLFSRRVLRLLEGVGYKAMMYPYLLSQKRMAQLAGLGNYGKNSLIINPRYGPWIRLHSILTDADLVPDEPFEDDLCGDCEECVKACPVGAITPYRVDPDRCIVGMYYPGREISSNLRPIFDEYMPKLSENSVLMCMACQKACPYGREERN
jgi:epoxyqueuosine reductase